MRLGDFPDRTVATGQYLHFEPSRASSNEFIPLPHPEAYEVLKAGDAISIDDGRLTGLVENVQSDHIVVRMTREGLLRSRKGFNRAVHPVVRKELSARDVEMTQVAYAAGCRSFAVSFIVDGRECDWVRRLVGPVELIAKIERADALVNIASIARQCDVIWVCRGDLGVQLGLASLGQAVAAIDPSQFRIPLLMAGQVFEHLTKHTDATRSEVCHAYDLMNRGYAGIVLSDETAIGCDPLNAARVARALLDASVNGRVDDPRQFSGSS